MIVSALESASPLVAHTDLSQLVPFFLQTKVPPEVVGARLELKWLRRQYHSSGSCYADSAAPARTAIKVIVSTASCGCSRLMMDRGSSSSSK